MRIAADTYAETLPCSAWTVLMEPLHFGPAERPLFGIYHPPESGVSRDAWLICNPLGQEAIRSYRLAREIAIHASAGGSHVLRFDYTGCGDSGGSEDDYSIVQWVADIRTAATELMEISGIDRIHVFGIRLGASLAMLAADSAQFSGRVIGIDPILSGKAYIEQMRLTHANMLHDPDRFAIRRDIREAPNDLLGFRLERHFLDELGKTTLQFREMPSKLSAHIICTTDGPALQQFRALQSAPGSAAIALSEVEFDLNWSDAPHLERTLVEPGLAAEVCRLVKS